MMNNAGDYMWQCPYCGEFNDWHYYQTGEWTFERCFKCQELFVMKNPKHKEDDTDDEI